MAHEVFISYSSKDKTIADATCATLEARGLRCWIAPRDILPSSDWGESIVNAIRDARSFVLVFSAHANESQQIKREVERAVNHGIPIIPFRIENVLPARALEYYLSTPHWLDAYTPPLEQHLNYLADTLHHVLDGAPAPSRPRQKRSFRNPIPEVDRRWQLIALGLGALLIAGLAAWLLLGRSSSASPPDFTGRWEAANVSFNMAKDAPATSTLNLLVKMALDAGNSHGTFKVDPLNQYTYATWAEDHGRVRALGNGKFALTSDLTHQTLELDAFDQGAAPYAEQYGGAAATIFWSSPNRALWART